MSGGAGPELVAIVDPGTVTLRVLIAQVRPRRGPDGARRQARERQRGQATIQGWDERPGSLDLGVDAPYLELICEEALAHAEAEAAERLEHREEAGHLLVGLPGCQLRGWAWSYSQRRSRPERPVEPRELEALLSRAFRRTVTRLGGSDRAGWLVVDAAPVALTIDGQGVTDPVGFHGEMLGATVFAALARVETVSIWRQVAESLRFATLTLCAMPLALADGRSEPQGLLVDIGGRTTDLVWYRAGHPLALASLPAGGETLTLALRRKWGLAADKAEQLKLAYAGSGLADEIEVQVREAMVPAIVAWLQQTESALADMQASADCPLPQQVYLLGGGSLLPEIYDAARSLAWSEQLTFDRYPQMARLEPTGVPGVINRSDRGHTTADVAALSLAAWAATAVQAGGQRGAARHEDRPARILRDLCAS